VSFDGGMRGDDTNLAIAQASSSRDCRVPTGVFSLLLTASVTRQGNMSRFLLNSDNGGGGEDDARVRIIECKHTRDTGAEI